MFLNQKSLGTIQILSYYITGELKYPCVKMGHMYLFTYIM